MTACSDSFHLTHVSLGPVGLLFPNQADRQNTTRAVAARQRAFYILPRLCDLVGEEKVAYKAVAFVALFLLFAVHLQVLLGGAWSLRISKMRAPVALANLQCRRPQRLLN